MPHKDPEVARTYQREYQRKRRQRPEVREYHRTWAQQWRDANPEAYRATIVRKYGITPEDYERLLSEQSGVCAVCGEAEKRTTKYGAKRVLAVDHDHETGQVRGLLCSDCNVILGLSQDSPMILQRAIDYLESKTC